MPNVASNSQHGREKQVGESSALANAIIYIGHAFVYAPSHTIDVFKIMTEC